MRLSPVRQAGTLAAALCFLLPSAALAETLTVDPADTNDACARTGDDKTCKTISAAITAAEGGDTIKILKGTYAETVSIPADRDALKLEGAGIADVKLTGTGTGDVVSIAGDDVVLSGLTVDVGTNAGSAALITGTGAALNGVSLARQNASDVNDPVVDVTSGSGTISKAIVVQNAGATGTTAINSSGGGFSILDTVVINLKGPAVRFSTAPLNRIIRSTVVSTDAASHAVEMLTTAGVTDNKKLLADSSVLVGGANGAGLLAKSTGADTGDLTIDLRHVTIAGAKNGLILDATGAAGPLLPASNPAGNITATVTSSIVHGDSTANEHAGALLPPTAANNVALTYASSDAPLATGSGEIVMGNATNTPDAQLFVPSKLSLRADAPVIDKGSAPAAEDSQTDFEGDARVTGPASDIGADEYTNKPPVAKFGITNANPRAGEAIGFVSGSSDPEQAAGGGVASYVWDFGDGTKQTTSVGGVTHAYAAPGTYQATLTVTDKGGLASAVSAPQAVTVRDGKPPTVKVTAPVANARITLNPLPAKPRKGSKRKPKAPRPLPLNVLGTAADESKVTKVEVSLSLTKRSKLPKLLARALKSQSKTKNCEHYTGSKGLTKRKCDQLQWFTAKLAGSDWSFRTSKLLRLLPGSYELRIRATDGSGLVSTPSTADGSVVKFRVK